MNDSVERIQIAPEAELNAILKDWASHLHDVALTKRQAMRLRILVANNAQCRKPVSPSGHLICTRMSDHDGPCAHTHGGTGVDLIDWVPAGLAAVLNVQPYHEEAL